MLVRWIYWDLDLDISKRVTWSLRVPRVISGLWGIKMREEVGGFLRTPLYTGHSPERIRKREDLPHPLGPVINTCCPGRKVRERLGTTTSPLGVTTGTRSSTNSFEVEGTTRPATLETTEALVRARSYLWKHKFSKDLYES